MANKIVEQKLIDSTKRALLKYVILGDGTAIANTVLVDVSNLAFALNTAGGLMISANNMKPHYKTTIKRITGQLGGPTGAGIKLNWHRTVDQPATEIVAIGTGSFEFSFDSPGTGGVIANPDTTAANGNGDILISSTGTTPNTLTLIIDLHKNNEDYDAGQTADPMAFNRGTRGL